MEHTKIGCEAYIVRDNKILLGRRGNVAGKGTWALPGGHLEFIERADECICRELAEETGLIINPKDIKLVALTDDLQPENNIHYLHITFEVNIGDQEPRLLEPNECEEWKFFNLNELPTNMFEPHQKIFKTIRSKKTYKS